ERGARPASAGVVSLYQVKDDGQVFLRIRGSNPACVLRVAAEEAEHVRHGESLWLFQHGPGEAPIRVKRAPARDPFTLREKIATGRLQSDDNVTGRTRGRWVEFLSACFCGTGPTFSTSPSPSWRWVSLPAAGSSGPTSAIPRFAAPAASPASTWRG